jgi:hypothetical protein
MTYLKYLQDYAQQDAEPTAKHASLTEQIQALIAPLPDIQRNRPWSVSELIPQLRGRYQDRPASREVAQALTELGWQQRRCWKKSGLNRRFWYPPTQEKLT